MSQSAPFGGNLRGAVDLSALAHRSTSSGAASGAGSDRAAAAAGDAGMAATVSADGTGATVTSLIMTGTDANFEEFIRLSSTVPIIVDLWADWCEPCKQLSPIIERVVREHDGRLLLVKVDVDANPQLAQAFGAQSIPAVAGIIGGRPLSLFVGALPEAQVRDVMSQVLELAAQNGVTGTVSVSGADAGADGLDDVEPEPEPLPPHHQEAYDAIERGDFEAAISEYTTAIAQDPRDAMAVAGLAQVRLLQRVNSMAASDVRSEAAERPDDVDAQLAVADLDVAGGHLSDAFDRLLGLFARTEPASKERIRTRLIDYFEVAGAEHPDVARARARLAALLY